MPASTDALLTKTDAELRFFTENPQLYQPELVEAARQELRRRGAAASNSPAASSAPAASNSPAASTGPATSTGPVADNAPPVPAPDYASEYFDEPARPRPALVPALVVGGALALGAGIYWWSAASQEAAKATAAAAAARAARLSPDSLKLETAVSTPLPTFDVEQDVARQLALVPAAERRQASAQALRQYREVSRRFWRAEHPTEFIFNTVAAGKVPSYAIMGQQISFIESQWHQAGNALVYTYNFPPTMADQLARMRSVASTERVVLEAVKQQVLANQSVLLSDQSAAKHAADEALLEGLRHPAKPLQVHL